MKIAAADIADIALGGAFLATGGGGDTLIGEITTEAALAEHGPVDLLPLDALDDDALVVAIGAAGAPTIMLEKTGNGLEAGWALDALERHLGRKASALIAFEAGGQNALVPFHAAAARGLPVVDADGMGRAFPELQMESFSIYGVSATPLALAADLGDRMVLDHARSPEIAERLIRQFLMIAGGGQCMSAEHVMTGAVAKDVSIPGTISLCLEIGRRLKACGSRIDAFVADLAALLAPTHYGEVRRIFDGKVIDVARRMEGGYDYGDLSLAPLGAEGPPLKIRIKNEYLLATREARPLAMTPDLICLVDIETGRPITAETLRYGQRASVIAVGAPERMRTPRALEVVSPRNFGFDIDYMRLEDLPAP